MFSWLSILDIIILLLIGWGAYKGFKNGVVKELAGLIGFVLAIWAGFSLAFIFADFYKEKFEIPSSIIPVIAFLSAFVLMLVVVILLGKVLDKIIKGAALSTFNKIMGLVFGVLKLAFVTGALIGVLGKSRIFSDRIRQDSFTYPILEVYCEATIEYSIGWFPKAKNVFSDLDEYFHELYEKRKSVKGNDSDH